MKRLVSLVAIAGVVITPLVAHSAPAKPKKKVRTVTFDYTGPCYADTPAVDGGPNACQDTAGLLVQPAKDELFLSYKAVDQTGQPVSMVVFKNDDFDTRMDYCSTGKEKLKKAVSIQLVMQVSSACSGVPTKGTITVTLSNLP